MKKIRSLSLGAGVQSTTLALLAARGEIEPPDFAVFADTGWEPRAVYKHLWRIAEAVPFPVIVVRKGDGLREDLVAYEEGRRARFATVPFYVVNPNGTLGMGWRKCTREYKLEPISRELRRQYGAEPRQRIPKGAVEVLIGISTDEAQRMKPSRVQWQTNVYPLIDLGISRKKCKELLEAWGWGDTPKSACLGCPFSSDAQWLRQKKESPDEFAETVALDELLRSGSAGSRTWAGNRYLHRSATPLKDAVFDPHENQIDLFGNECEGMCGV